MDGPLYGRVAETVGPRGVRGVRHDRHLRGQNPLPERVRWDAAQRVRVPDGLAVEAQRELVLEPKQVLSGVQDSIPPAGES